MQQETKHKIYILTANENWICDQLKKEFEEMNKKIVTNDYNAATVIWILSDYCYKKIPMNVLMKKKVITTIHHIDKAKLDDKQLAHYNLLDGFTDIFHTICEKTKEDLRTIVTKKIIIIPFWIDHTRWFNIENKQVLRNKYKFNTNDYLIGSFQRDTEGNSIKNQTYLPKLSKGPDIFCDIIERLILDKPNIAVVLTGWRRQYVINRLTQKNIKYYYFEMIDQKELNELYNCLDLYIISSRVEGGPRAAIECAISKTPVISTDVGFVSTILATESIYNKLNDIDKCKPNINIAYENASKLINNYAQFIELLLK